MTRADDDAAGEQVFASVRNAIDELDERILALLDERARLAAEAGRLKRETGRALYDPEREERVLSRLQATQEGRAGATFPARSVRAVFREVISACLAVEEPLRVAFLGPEGTFTHMAARSTFGLAVRYVEAATIAGVFDAVERGLAEHGVVPIENSTEGSVTFTMDCLVETTAKIRSEVEIDVAHCLVARREDLSRIERVYSHPQALAQCRSWLAKHLPNAQLVVSPSTGAAAREARADEAAAAIASRLAGELAGLLIVREGIQDRERNATRFIVLGAEDAPPTGNDKTSIVFSAPDERGALRKILEIFDDEGINLSRIESRPTGRDLWQYVFLTDLAGHRRDPGVARALERLAAHCRMTRVLGSFPAARRISTVAADPTRSGDPA